MEEKGDKKYGEAYIVGSYGMNIMTWNDLDFYIDKSSLNGANYYGLASEILKKFVALICVFKGKNSLEKRVHMFVLKLIIHTEMFLSCCNTDFDLKSG